jgi:hypothetical protein
LSNDPEDGSKHLASLDCREAAKIQQPSADQASGAKDLLVEWAWDVEQLLAVVAVKYSD